VLLLQTLLGPIQPGLDDNREMIKRIDDWVSLDMSVFSHRFLSQPAVLQVTKLLLNLPAGVEHVVDAASTDYTKSVLICKVRLQAL